MVKAILLQSIGEEEDGSMVGRLYTEIGSEMV
jgi:hypothetical protein